MFVGFAAALLSVADSDSASGDELLEAAERLGTNREEHEAREKPVKRYEHLTGFAYWGLELLDFGERGD